VCHHVPNALYQPWRDTERACAVVRLTAVTAYGRQGRDTAAQLQPALIQTNINLTLNLYMINPVM